MDKTRKEIIDFINYYLKKMDKSTLLITFGFVSEFAKMHATGRDS